MKMILTSGPIRTILSIGNRLFKAAPEQVQDTPSAVPYPIGQVCFALMRLNEIKGEEDLVTFMDQFGWNILEQQLAWFHLRSKEEMASLEKDGEQYPSDLARAYLDFKQVPVGLNVAC